MEFLPLTIPMATYPAGKINRNSFCLNFDFSGNKFQIISEMWNFTNNNNKKKDIANWRRIQLNWLNIDDSNILKKNKWKRNFNHAVTRPILLCLTRKTPCIRNKTKQNEKKTQINGLIPFEAFRLWHWTTHWIVVMRWCGAVVLAGCEAGQTVQTNEPNVSKISNGRSWDHPSPSPSLVIRMTLHERLCNHTNEECMIRIENKSKWSYFVWQQINKFFHCFCFAGIDFSIFWFHLGRIFIRNQWPFQIECWLF